MSSETARGDRRFHTEGLEKTKCWVSRFATIDGKRTHYLEAGEGDPLILLHSGEFGACAEFTWEFNIDALALFL